MTSQFGRVRRGGTLLLAVLALSLSACASAPGPGPAAVPAPPAAGGTARGAAALDFARTTLDGATLDAATLAGTPVALWFWAPWCTICRAEAPDIAAVAAEFQGRVRVLGVPGRGEVEAMKGFVADTGTGTITHLADTDGTLWNRFGVVSQPAFAFVDRTGAVQRVSGPLDRDQLRAVLGRLA